MFEKQMFVSYMNSLHCSHTLRSGELESLGCLWDISVGNVSSQEVHCLRMYNTFPLGKSSRSVQNAQRVGDSSVPV